MILLLVEVCVHCDKVSVYTVRPDLLHKGVTYNPNNGVVCKSCVDHDRHITDEDDISFE